MTSDPCQVSKALRIASIRLTSPNRQEFAGLPSLKYCDGKTILSKLSDKVDTRPCLYSDQPDALRWEWRQGGLHRWQSGLAILFVKNSSIVVEDTDVRSPQSKVEADPKSFDVQVPLLKREIQGGNPALN
jgi:hypothetical protein